MNVPQRHSVLYSWEDNLLAALPLKFAKEFEYDEDYEGKFIGTIFAFFENRLSIC